MVGASLPAPAPHSWPQQDTVCLDDELQLSEHREELHQNQDQEEPLKDVSDNELIDTDHDHLGDRVAEDVEYSSVGEVEWSEERQVVVRSRCWMRRIDQDTIITQQCLQLITESVAEFNKVSVHFRVLEDKFLSQS